MMIMNELTGRQRSLLRAVAAGRCELTCSQEPDMFVDGLFCCDQLSARQLVRARLVAGAASAPGERAPAALTDDGWTALSLAAA